MPADWTGVGVLAFAGVKFAGYTSAGYLLRRAYNTDSPNPFYFGAVRTALGIAVGVSFATLIHKFLGVESSDSVFFMALLPIRFGEWFFVILLFFGKDRDIGFKIIGLSILGVLWSYLLDFPAIFAAFYVPGGWWIC